MSNIQADNKPATKSSRPQRVDMKLEVAVLPVTAVDRAKRFYADLGWRIDADFARADGSRAVQRRPGGPGRAPRRRGDDLDGARGQPPLRKGLRPAFAG